MGFNLTGEKGKTIKVRRRKIRCLIRTVAVSSARIAMFADDSKCYKIIDPESELTSREQQIF